MEVTRVSDLCVAVLCALAIHGGIAAMRVSFPSVMPEAGPAVKRPLNVRLDAAMIEVPEEEQAMPPEERIVPVVERRENIEKQTPALPDVAVPMDRKEMVKEEAAPIAQSPAVDEGRVKKPAERAITESSEKAQPTTEVKKKRPVASSEKHPSQVTAEPVPPQKVLTAKSPARPDVVAAVPRYRDNPPPLYPSVARRRGYEGLVILSVVVRSDGTVGDVRVKESSGKKILDRAAVSGVRAWRFEPGSRDGVVCEMTVDVPIRFVLQE